MYELLEWVWCMICWASNQFSGNGSFPEIQMNHCKSDWNGWFLSVKYRLFYWLWLLQGYCESKIVELFHPHFWSTWCLDKSESSQLGQGWSWGISVNTAFQASWICSNVTFCRFVLIWHFVSCCITCLISPHVFIMAMLAIMNTFYMFMSQDYQSDELRLSFSVLCCLENDLLHHRHTVEMCSKCVF